MKIKILFYAFTLLYSGIILPQTSGDRWMNFNITNSAIASNAIHSVSFDTDGSIWIATWDKGISVLKSARHTSDHSENMQWETFDTSNSGLPDNRIYQILIDKAGRKWITTFGGGLVTLSGNEWKIFNTSNSGIPHDWLYGACLDDSGSIWIGTWGGGLCRYKTETGQWTVFNKYNSPLPSMKIPSVLVDHNSRVWAGTLEGLWTLESGQWKQACDSIVPEGSVYSLAMNRKGLMAAGLKADGLALFDGSRWMHYDMINSGLPSNVIYSADFDAEGNLWIGTFGSGLVKYDGKSWTVYNDRNSLLTDNYIFAVKVDSYGNKWICTLKSGLFIFNENGINKF